MISVRFVLPPDLDEYMESMVEYFDSRFPDLHVSAIIKNEDEEIQRQSKGLMDIEFEVDEDWVVGVMATPSEPTEASKPVGPTEDAMAQAIRLSEAVQLYLDNLSDSLDA